jgi:hypothetical protein
MELHLHFPIRLHGVVLSLKKYRDNFTFTFYRNKFTCYREGLEWSDSRSGLHTLGERVPGTYWTGDLLGPRAGMDVVAKRKNSFFGSTGTLTPIVQPAA